MKKIIILFCIFNSLFVYSQKIKTIIFYNGDMPIEDVKVSFDNTFLASSNQFGICEISDTINSIYCNYCDIIDSVVDVGKCDTCIIEFHINLLKETIVLDEYNAKNHLINLLDFNNKLNNDIDTVLYYKIQIENIVQGINKKEIFEGIIKAIYTGNSKDKFYSFEIIKIDNYFNTIGARFLPDSLYFYVRVDNIISMQPYKEKNLLRKIIFDRNNKNSVINLYQKNDSVIFKFDLFRKHEDKNYLTFNSKVLAKMEIFKNYSNARHNNTFPVLKYSIIDYFYDKNIYSKKGYCYYEYIIKKKSINHMLTSKLYFENIPNPNMEFEIKETFNYFNNINLHIETIKQNHPEIIIPSYSKTQYKFYD